MGFRTGFGIGIGTGLYCFLSYWKLRFMGHRIRAIGLRNFLVFLVFSLCFLPLEGRTVWNWKEWDHSLRAKRRLFSQSH